MSIKSRKSGNSIVLSVPKKLNVVAGIEYNVSKKDDGSILFVPVHQEQQKINFVSDQEAFFDLDEIFSEYNDVFKGLVDR